MKYIITEENATKILQYLVGKPYNEVILLIQILQTMQKFEEPKSEKVETKKE